MEQNQNIGKKWGSITRACSKCGGDLGHRYGKQRYCCSCHAAFMRKTRPRHSELSDEAKKKATARSYANVYVKNGLIKREPCQVCQAEKAEKHHPDYSKPTQVIWLCRTHHFELHKQTI